MVYLGARGNDPDLAEDATSDQERRVSKTKARIFLNAAGEDANDLAATFGLGDNDLDKLIEAFDNYAAPKWNETYVTYVFNQCCQKKGETFHHFRTEAKTLIKSCGYGEQENSILGDRIVTGIRDHLREALLRIDNLKLKHAIRDCRAAERSKMYNKKLTEKEDKQIPLHAVHISNWRSPPLPPPFPWSKF
ncbi:hypothetical protein PR048_031991 [Dryococelus australis]|uniref:Uncharacterized protein n=1 Tax=Dryococelus australis TaxID=614101 RepID=A0ABQ9G9N0_9NEOP|nr:hypothetical protein PR048_031991 [Dryococelus australis]